MDKNIIKYNLIIYNYYPLVIICKNESSDIEYTTNIAVLCYDKMIVLDGDNYTQTNFIDHSLVNKSRLPMSNILITNSINKKYNNLMSSLYVWDKNNEHPLQDIYSCLHIEKLFILNCNEDLIQFKRLKKPNLKSLNIIDCNWLKK